MYKYILTFFILCFSFASFAQKGTLRGRLIDSVDGQSLKSASITVLDAQDSTLEVFGLSDEEGNFNLRGISQGQFIVKITFEGYKTVRKRITINKEKLLADLGNIYMKIKAKDLQEVIVEAAPMTIKKDTIEYNASSFKTKPNSVVEDLLKKLPGVEVDTKGAITAQGETVQRVLVDGKRFFGEDPKMATRNLPPDMVDKIQVYDAQSDQSAFSGFDDGTRTKTINITTKKDKRAGYFGKAMAGGGNEGRYEASATFNRFKNNQQMSFVSEANNVNKQAFSVQDFLGNVGRGGGGRGAGELGGGNSSTGITTVWAAGLNYKDVWGKSTEAYGSYFYNNVAINNISNSLTQRFATNPDSSQFATQASNSLNQNQNHRFNFNIEMPIDSANSMIIRPNISYQSSTVGTQTGTNTTLNKVSELSNVNQRVNTYNNGFNNSMDVLFRHRFKLPGHTYSINISGGNTSNDGTLNNYDTTKTLRGLDTLNQYNNNGSNAQNISTTLSYTHPVAKNQLIQLGANYSYNVSTSDQNTYSADSTGKYTLPVNALTNNFKNSNESERFTLGYRIQNNKLSFGVTGGVQFTNLNSTNRTADTISIIKHYTNLYPAANLMYSFTRTTNIRINYNGRTSAPSLSQLQPVTNNTNQLNITTGNPNLSQAFTNSIRIFFTSFDVFKLRNIFAVINASNTLNGIVSDITQINVGTKAGTQHTTYINKSGAYSVSGYFNYGFQLSNPKSNLNFSTNLSTNRNISILNGSVNNTFNSDIGEKVGWTMNLNEKFDLNLHASTNYSSIKNSINTQTNANYFTNSIWAEPTYTFKGGWVFSNDFTYTFYSGRTSGYNVSVPLWNAYVSKLLFKKQNGELKFALYDILNKNQNVTRTTTNNSVADVQNNVLKQYYSITFTYNLRKFAAQQPAIPGIFRGMHGMGGGRGGRDF